MLPTPRKSKNAHGFYRNRPREAKPATVFCRNERRETKTPTVFIEKRQKLRIPWTESSKNGKNCEFRGRNHQKTEKTGFHPRMTSEKRKKPRIPWTESSKNRKNRLSSTDDERKTEKTAFPPRGKIKIIRFLRFPLEGKAKTFKNCVSPRREKQNHPKTDFPPRPKICWPPKLFLASAKHLEIRKHHCSSILLPRMRGSSQINFVILPSLNNDYDKKSEERYLQSLDDRGWRERPAYADEIHRGHPR